MLTSCKTRNAVSNNVLFILTVNLDLMLSVEDQGGSVFVNFTVLDFECHLEECCPLDHSLSLLLDSFFLVTLNYEHESRLLTTISPFPCDLHVLSGENKQTERRNTNNARDSLPVFRWKRQECSFTRTEN